MEKNEIRPIPRFSNHEISKEGIVRHVRTKKPLTPHVPKRGTPTIQMTDDNGNRTGRALSGLLEEIWGVKKQG